MVLALALVFQPMLGLTMKAVTKGGAIGLSLSIMVIGAAFYLDADETVLPALIAGALIAAATFRQGRKVFIVGAGLIVMLPLWLAGPDTRLFADRSFFGLHQVLEMDGVRVYSNGTTLHGAQRLSDMGAARPTPTTYYHPAAPMGQVMQSALGQSAERVGIVGLGVGSLACYANEGQDWHLYEIDAMVDRVARDPSLFTFLSACTPDAPTHLGDARVVLAGQDMRFDVLVIDAYSSDAVPVHLTTLEAMALYLDRLTEDGVLVFHISNRFYDIGLPLARSADALGVHAWRQFQAVPASDDPGYRQSDVAIIARDPAHVAELLESGDWTPMVSDGGPIWTDDKANPLSILKPGALH